MQFLRIQPPVKHSNNITELVIDRSKMELLTDHSNNAINSYL